MFLTIHSLFESLPWEKATFHIGNPKSVKKWLIHTDDPICL